MDRVLIGISIAGLMFFSSSKAQAEPPQKIFALVVANNHSLDRSQRDLRYADDDGARFFELMSAVATRSILLAVLDAKTQQSYPDLGKQTQPPRRNALRRAMKQLGMAISKARKEGHRTVFYFYFAGHGDVGKDREGYINLQDGRFGRSDLYREVISRSTADVNHIIIDACNSYFLINRRGGQGARSAVKNAINSFLSKESLAQHPNTGVVLSTATMAETHEWSRYQSGIFSHQLLSAMWGSADVNGDRRVDYHELGAYIAAANLKVRDSRARLAIYARPPRADRRTALINLQTFKRVGSKEKRPAPGRVAGFLELPRSMHGHYYLEDDRGIRFLDFNKTAEQPLRLALLDRPYYYLRSSTHEAVIKPSAAQDIDAGQLSFSEIPTRSRGSVEQSFRRDLYAFPFGQGFAVGHRSARVEQLASEGRPQVLLARPPVERPWYGRVKTWKWVMASTAVASLATAISMQVLAGQSAEELQAGAGKISMSRAVELQDESNQRQTVAGVAFGIAGTAAVTTTLLFLVDQIDSRPGAQAWTGVGAAASARGGSLTLSGTF